MTTVVMRRRGGVDATSCADAERDDGLGDMPVTVAGWLEVMDRAVRFGSEAERMEMAETMARETRRRVVAGGS